MDGWLGGLMYLLYATKKRGKKQQRFIVCLTDIQTLAWQHAEEMGTTSRI